MHPGRATQNPVLKASDAIWTRFPTTSQSSEVGEMKHERGGISEERREGKGEGYPIISEY